MAKIKRGLFGLVVIGMMATSSSAELIASESFAVGGEGYTNALNFNHDNNKGVMAGTSGFTEDWVNGSALVQPRDLRNLTHVGLAGAAQDGCLWARPGNAVGLGRNSSRALSATPSGRTFYMSGLVNVSGLTNLADGESVAMGLIGSIGANVWVVNSGLHLGAHRTNEGAVHLAAFAAGNTYLLGDALTSSQAAETQMIVLRLDLDTGPGGEDTLTGWIAHEGESELQLVLNVWDMNTGSNANLATFVVQSLGNDQVNSMGVYLDEFRFGSTWESVTTIERPRPQLDLYFISMLK